MGALIECGYWWWMLATSKYVRVRGLRILYISADDNRTSNEIQSAIGSALDLISAARGGFGELVTGHLRFTAAVSGTEGKVLRHARGYVSAFPRLELDNPTYLACRLIWAATYVRLSNQMSMTGKLKDVAAFREAARLAQLRFVRQFDDADRWEAYLDRTVDGV